MIVIDSCALVVLLTGLINPKLKTRRTSIYDREDFEELLGIIKDFKNLVVLPNIWTETDNLLNDLGGNYKWPYIQWFRSIVSNASEKYIESALGAASENFISVGLTDSLILKVAKKSDLIITADTRLSDLARANGFLVYDLIFEKNYRLKHALKKLPKKDTHR